MSDGGAARRQPGARAVKAVTFDADDTLWNFDEAMRAGLARVLREVGRLAPAWAARLSVDGMIAARDRAEAELKGTGASLIDVRREGIRRSLPPEPAADERVVERLLAVYREERDRVLVPFEDVVPAVRALRGRVVLGVVSNGNSRPERHGLAGCFQFVLLSDDHGIEKPDPRVFHMAAEAAGCAPWEIAHVGDSLHTDVEGANRVGAISVWLNRTRRSTAPGGPRPAYAIGSLGELPGLIAGMAPG